MTAFRCPETPAHGKLLDMGRSWHCPAQDHDGYRNRPASRAFFTSQEAETGVLSTSRPAPVIPATVESGARRSPVRTSAGPGADPDAERVELASAPLT